MPLDGTPADVVARVTGYDEWLATSPGVPKLLVTFAPGYGTMTVPAVVDWCADTVAALEIDRYDEVAGHHTPEDQPDLLARSLTRWLRRHQLR
jgi:haloalkane dehalogenase